MRRDIRSRFDRRILRQRRRGWILRILILSAPVLLMTTLWLFKSPPHEEPAAPPQANLPPNSATTPDQSVDPSANPTPASSGKSASGPPAMAQPGGTHQKDQGEVAFKKTWSAPDLSGKWVLNHTIHREIEIQPDGTAVMNCTLDYFTSLIYGKQLTMNLEWTLEEDLLRLTVISGTPEKNVKSLTDNFGSSMSYRILNVDHDQLLLQGPGKSKKQEHWKAVRPELPMTPERIMPQQEPSSERSPSSER